MQIQCFSEGSQGLLQQSEGKGGDSGCDRQERQSSNPGAYEVPGQELEAAQQHQILPEGPHHFDCSELQGVLSHQELEFCRYRLLIVIHITHL